MATQYWDSTQNTRHLAEQIDSFLYLNGRTSPKVKKYNEHTEEEYRLFLDYVRLYLWDEHQSMMRDLGHN